MAASCQRIFVVMPHSKRAMVGKLDFLTSLGHGEGGNSRARHGVRTAGPVKVITDLCVMEPDPVTRELTVSSVHPGVARDRIQASTGWPIRFADRIAETETPSAQELEVLRRLKEATENAHRA
jgi:glutaconate CoA-transferase subunit B